MSGRQDLIGGSNVRSLPANRPATLAEKWREGLKQKPTATEAVALLTTCLALVRPAGFGDGAASDWLTTAAGDVAYIPIDILTEACRHARRTCDHHSKVVPAIVAFSDAEIASRARHIRQSDEYSAALLPPLPRWVPEPGELDRIKAAAAARWAEECAQGAAE